MSVLALEEDSEFFSSYQGCDFDECANGGVTNHQRGGNLRGIQFMF